MLNKIYSEKIIEIRRVTKVVKGGKKLSFRTIIALGNNENMVGIGIGQSENTALSIEKAIKKAKKSLILVPITKTYSIPYSISISFGSAKIFLYPKKIGSGIKASGPLYTIFKLSGLKNISAKQLGSNNIINNMKATILALNYF